VSPQHVKPVPAPEPKYDQAKWSGVDEALGAAKSSGKLALIVFCTADEALTVGAGTATAKEYRLKHQNRLPTYTVMDSADLVKMMGEEGIVAFAKIANTAENAKYYKQFNVSRTQILIVGPDGKALRAMQTTVQLDETCKPTPTAKAQVKAVVATAMKEAAAATAAKPAPAKAGG